MLKYLLSLIVFLTFLQQSFADHIKSASFELINNTSNNRLTIRLMVYQDCSGISSSPFMSVQWKSNWKDTTLQLNRVQIDTASNIHPSFTSCVPNSPLPYGARKTTYEVTFPYAPFAQEANLFFLAATRGLTIYNLANLSGAFVVTTAQINLRHANSTPKNFHDPIYYHVNHQDFHAALGAYDEDGDSLAFSLKAPLRRENQPMSFIPGFSAQSPFAIQSGTNVEFDSTTGSLHAAIDSFFFSSGAYCFDVEVREYRNGQLISTSTRSILNYTTPSRSMINQTIITNNNNQNLALDTLNSTIPFQAGAPLTIDLDFEDVDTGDSLVYKAIYSSINKVFPNATVQTTYINALNKLRVSLTIPNPRAAFFDLVIEENGQLRHQFTYKLVSSVLSSHQQPIQHNIQQFPTPVVNKSTWVLDKEYAHVELYIYNQMGQLVDYQQVQNSQQFTWNNSKLATGLYFYQLIGDKEQLQSERLIIQ